MKHEILIVGGGVSGTALAMKYLEAGKEWDSKNKLFTKYTKSYLKMFL